MPDEFLSPRLLPGEAVAPAAWKPWLDDFTHEKVENRHSSHVLLSKLVNDIRHSDYAHTLTGKEKLNIITRGGLALRRCCPLYDLLRAIPDQIEANTLQLAMKRYVQALEEGREPDELHRVVRLSHHEFTELQGIALKAGRDRTL